MTMIINSNPNSKYGFRLLFCLGSFFINLVVYGQRFAQDSSVTLFAKIDFQEKFTGDTVSFWINKQKVFGELCMKSHSILDFTGVTVQLFRHGDKKLMLMYSGEKQFVRWNAPLLYLEVIVNRVKSSFYIDCNKAKAMGIYKVSGDSVKLRYHDCWFTYE